MIYGNAPHNIEDFFRRINCYMPNLTIGKLNESDF